MSPQSLKYIISHTVVTINQISKDKHRKALADPHDLSSA